MDKKNINSNRKKVFKLLILIAIILIIATIAVILNKKNVGDLDSINNKEEVEKSKYDNGIPIDYGVVYEEDDLNMKNTNPGGIDVEKLDNAKVVEGEKENTSNLLLENREFEGLEFSNIKLKSINGVSNFTAIVKNNTDNVIDTKMLSLKFVDKDGNLISNLKIYIPTLGSESTTTVDASITADIINAYNFTIENIE